jgi:hypothetical protein
MSKIDQLKADFEKLPSEERSELFRWLIGMGWRAERRAGYPVAPKRRSRNQHSHATPFHLQWRAARALVSGRHAK